MPATSTQYLYWDACVFLAYLNDEAGRVEIVDQIWQEVAESDDVKIITASLSIAEVAFAAEERSGSVLETAALGRLDRLWQDPSVYLVDMPANVMYIARRLKRDAQGNGWVLKTADAVHLATATWVDQQMNTVQEFHTFDESLFKYGALVGIRIAEPTVDQPRLL